MNKNNECPKAGIYMLLLAIQIFGAILFVWQQLPSFRQIAGNPGEQLPYDAFGDLMTVGILFIMQISFWYRLLYSNPVSTFEHIPELRISVSRAG
jgi:hypothetical protein